MDASDEQAPRKLKTSKHHFRPRSRGGNNSLENLIAIPDHEAHVPYHALFTNLRPHEAYLLLYFAWETLSIPLNRQHHQMNHLDHWEMLFGKDATPESAMQVLWSRFVKNDEDRELMEHAHAICEYARARGIPRIGRIYSYGDEMLMIWTDDVDYKRIFGRLLPHEAILVSFLSWHTFCAHRELESMNTHLDKNTRRPVTKAFDKRVTAWEYLFRDGDPQMVIETINHLFVDKRDSEMKALVEEAKKICRRIENSGFLRH